MKDKLVSLLVATLSIFFTSHKTLITYKTLIIKHVENFTWILALILHAAGSFQGLNQTVFVCDSLLEMKNLELVDFKLLL